jgi:hypothetical protein
VISPSFSTTAPRDRVSVILVRPAADADSVRLLNLYLHLHSFIPSTPRDATGDAVCDRRMDGPKALGDCFSSSGIGVWDRAPSSIDCARLHGVCWTKVMHF